MREMVKALGLLLAVLGVVGVVASFFADRALPLSVGYIVAGVGLLAAERWWRR